jgi:UDPglucose 6-dehydrogenase
MERLWDAGARVQAYDPEAMQETARIYPDQDGLTLCDTAEATLDGADALVIVTEWQEFRSPDFDQIKKSLSEPVIFDGRNLYEPSLLSTMGITYYAIGRSNNGGDNELPYGRRKTDMIGSG